MYVISKKKSKNIKDKSNGNSNSNSIKNTLLRAKALALWALAALTRLIKWSL